ncbi:MFS transporter [Glycomyces sp. TRM65418]|uniref:MFS transporter n=1 Tax=Glycomyces sp. TRM65418 TaxID=2867006 RepID=UPI001CE587E4|nr:MFS transporter [Glycomyces sp. TRM65418]MCC3761491.1 MFS transporter [Glycomyces sp. TRM65418]QZD55589.1 MFS transporter [Glycomyces sp. TRM65418]
MTTTHTDRIPDPAQSPERERLPVLPLLALTTAAFMGILTEALPAGVLPEMAASLSVSESAAGQTLTVYAIATGLSAIPVVAGTASWPRRRLLLTAVLTFAVANLVTAISDSYPLTMAFRLFAGVAAAVVWAGLVGYARRLAPPRLQGRAIAMTMAGVPLALSLGIPLGTFLGDLFGWRLTFGLAALISALLMVWVRLSVPEFPGRPRGEREPILAALRLPGVTAVLFTVAAYVLAHNILYTYIAAFLDANGMDAQRDVVLLVFGIASVVSIFVTGALVDQRLRLLTIAGSGLFLVAAGMLTVLAGEPFTLYLAIILWGLGWGGATTLLQTAVTDAGGERGQALLVTTWNSSMAGGGAVGGLMLSMFGPQSFPWGAVLLMIPAVVVVIGARTHAFPAERPGLEGPVYTQ